MTEPVRVISMATLAADGTVVNAAVVVPVKVARMRKEGRPRSFHARFAGRCRFRNPSRKLSNEINSLREWFLRRAAHTGLMRRLGIVIIVFLFGCSFNSGATQEVSL